MLLVNCALNASNPIRSDTYRRALQAAQQVMVLQLEDVVVRLDLFAGLLRGQPGLARLLLADEGGATGRLGDADAGHARLLLSLRTGSGRKVSPQVREEPIRVSSH